MVAKSEEAKQRQRAHVKVAIQNYKDEGLRTCQVWIPPHLKSVFIRLAAEARKRYQEERKMFHVEQLEGS